MKKSKQDEVIMSKELVRNIYQRINAVMRGIKSVAKGDKNSFLKYSYVSHDAVTLALHDLVAAEGIVIIPDIESFTQENNLMFLRLKVDFINMDDPEDRVTVRLCVPSAPRSSRENPKEVIDEKTFGASYSYAYKYALLKTFMLNTGEDADAQEEKPHSEGRNFESYKAPQRGEGEFISDAQVEEIRRLAKNPNTIGRILQFNGAATLEQITADKYPKIINFLTTPFVPKKVNGEMARAG